LLALERTLSYAAKFQDCLEMKASGQLPLADEPWFVLTGHTLMVGDLGRTELAVNAEVGARDLFKSALRLKALPDYVEVLPGAYAGSVCGRRLSGKPWSSIGFEKRYNKAFGIEDEAEFVRFMTADIPPAPREAAAFRAINSGAAAAAA
jgi:hydroxyacylglutathione hydrolase